MMRKPAVVSTLEEDFKRIGILPPSSTELSEGKMPAKAGKKKAKKVLEKKGKKAGKKAAPLLKMKKESKDVGESLLTSFLHTAKQQSRSASPAKPEVLVTGLERVSGLMEDVQDILKDLNRNASVDIVRGYENVSAVYKLVSKRYKALGEEMDSKELTQIGEFLAARSAKTESLAKKLGLHLSEGRGAQLDYDKVEARFRSHVATVVEALELFSEMDDMMKGEMDDEDEEDVESFEPDDELDAHDDSGPSMDDADGDDDGDDDADDADGDDAEGDDDADGDDAAVDSNGDDAEGDDDGDAGEEPDGDGDDDFLKKLDKGGDEGEDGEEDEGMDPPAMGNDSEEGDDDADMDLDADDDDGDLDHDSDDEEEDEEISVENVVDTSADSAKLTGKKVPQRKEGGVSPKGKIATDGDAGHGGNWKQSLPKGNGVMKGGKMESKSGARKGKGR